MSVIAFSPTIGPVPVAAVIKESHSSTLQVTQLPVEDGADITDHAVVMPKSVTLECADEAGAATFAALVAFQESRTPFSLVTGLMVYRNMLPINIAPERTKEFSKVFNGTIELQEIIIVGSSQAAPEGEDYGISGAAGGADSTRAASPSAQIAGDSMTADRAAASVYRGDVTLRSVPADQSIQILSRLFGG